MMLGLRAAASLSLMFVFGAGWVVAAGASTFERMSVHYETIRQALVHDRVEGIARDARRIGDLALDSGSAFDPAAAGVPADKADELRELLPLIREAATEVAAAPTIEDARAAFGRLSRALVRYRQMRPTPDVAVAYCSMAKQVWLQPEGEIGNPYYGQSMARCGEFVTE